MNVQFLIQAVTSIDEAAACTPEKVEREIIEGHAVALRMVLQRRGVFLGKMEHDETHPSTKLRNDALKALDCLFIAVPEDVATDVNQKVKTYISHLEAQLPCLMENL